MPLTFSGLVFLFVGEAKQKATAERQTGRETKGESMTTWRKQIESEMLRTGDSWRNIMGSTLTTDELDVEFDNGYGATEGKPFTFWTKTRVYFPYGYDGAEGVASVPRNPCSEATEHIGGG